MAQSLTPHPSVGPNLTTQCPTTLHVSNTLNCHNTTTQPTSIRTHPMGTHAQVGTIKQNPRFALHTSSISYVPKSPSLSLSDPNWRDALQDEYNATIKNSTWILVSKPLIVNLVQSMWCLDIRMFLSQKKYAMELLKRAHMLNCNPCRTLVDTELNPDGVPVAEKVC
ncbi:ribonuclease H-like domain-containing protein [Tanacetum coccineum]|uniref:Ribonuclease H-like domain-containing protein n=1 Tax=Tanacetum coccineum TaxID=301880 RepID=A0ABQ4ZTH0_9ASTR